MVELEYEMGQIAKHDHLCFVYENLAEQIAVMLPFMNDGFHLNHKTIYCSNDGSKRAVVKALHQAGIDTGALSFVTSKLSKRARRDFNPLPMIDLLRSQVENALAAGFSGVRLIIEMSWCLEAESAHGNLAEFEASLHHFIAESPAIALCQYDKHRFPAARIKEVLRCHATAILGNQMCRNFFYEPPDIRLGKPSVEDQVEWMIGKLKGFNAEERRHEEGNKTFLYQGKHFRLITETLPDVVSYADKDLRFRFVNPAYEKWFGLKPEDVCGRRVVDVLLDVIGEESYKEILSYMERALAGEVVSVETYIPYKAGAARYIKASYAPDIDLDGTVKGFFTIVNDISESKRFEASLRESEESFRAMFETASVGKAVANPVNGQFLQVNKKLCEMTGYTESELLSMNFFAITHADDQPRATKAWQRTYQGEDPDYYDEMRYVCKDGTIKWVAVNANLRLDKDGSPIKAFGVIQDITERKQVEREIRLAKSAAETANQMKSAFLANMSHELRTPLNAILGFSQLLKASDLDTDTRTDYIDIIDRNGNALIALIDDILDLSKIEAGQLKIVKERVPLSRVLTDLTSSIGIQAQKKGIEFLVRTSGPLPESIDTDPLRLRQILLNIAGNAVKFTEYGRVEVLVKLKDNGTQLRFVVKDTGCGIAEEAGKNLFQPFVQADPSLTRKFGGTGLGLILSRKLAQKLGGNVELVESHPGVGSTFEVFIDPGPMERKLESPIVPDQKKDPGVALPPPEALNGAKILVAEDSPDNQILIQRLLKRSGAQVDVVDDGAKAVKQAMNGIYDVILMDMHMPVLDGHAAVSTLRGKGYGKPIIALTAHALPEDRERSLLAGCDDHLSKPINYVQLIAMLAQYVRSSPSAGKYGR
ncbi:PAS domain S-box protein [Oligoflexus tunisiensis]|uniref:PAS domain S-box protein n=1 Tax=Oligoflexus tunisiensis TaxID=708132 RepID=UPI000AD95AC7|nr:PAS domain S-box protein [Oligoflexus tunisiensis]